MKVTKEIKVSPVTISKSIIVVGQKDVRTSTNANDWHRQYRK